MDEPSPASSTNPSHDLGLAQLTDGWVANHPSTMSICRSCISAERSNLPAELLS